jgi:hypothetical protein
MQNSNAINQPGRSAGVPAVLEMAALDDLGPATRWAIRNSPLPILAYSITSQIVELNDKIEGENEVRAARGLPLRPYADPKDPRLDERLAQGVLQTQAKLLLDEGVQIQDVQAGMKPLVSRPSPKTLRERRRTQRRIRW